MLEHNYMTWLILTATLRLANVTHKKELRILTNMQACCTAY